MPTNGRALESVPSIFKNFLKFLWAAYGAFSERETGARSGSGRGRPQLRPGGSSGSVLHRVVHLELDGVRGHLEARDLGHLQFDVAVDEVVVEDAAGLQEGAVLVQADERLAERAANGRDLLQLARGQVVEVFVH